MSIVILEDEMVHYEVLGRGKPLVFLHGWVGSWRYWVPTMQSVSISYRTYALDLWGFGDTAKAPDKYALDQQVDLLNLFLEEMGIGRIALIGHGLGAIVATLFATKFESKVVDRVMAISLPVGKTSLSPRLSNTSPAELAEWLLNRTSDNKVVHGDAPKADQGAIQSAIANTESLDMSSLTRGIKTPCLLVYGRNDPTLNGTLPGDTQIHPEHIHQINFNRSGHFPMLDQPNKFNRLLADFLSLSSGTSPRQLQIKEEWKRRVR